MKSLLDTKPTYCETVMTRDGWVDPKTGEMIVSVIGLYDRMMAELAIIQNQMAIMEANGETDK